MKFPPKPTAADVRRYRDENECSIFAARETLMRQWRIDTLQTVRMHSVSEFSVAAFRALIDLLIETEQQR